MGELEFDIIFWNGFDPKTISHVSIEEAFRGNYIEFSGNNMVATDECTIIRRYTGLEDKNGKKVFEGDMDENGDVVMWCDERNGWAMQVYDIENDEPYFCHCYVCEGYFELSEIVDDFEIIGNIWETIKL
ncbi:MAG: YopX family protein [Candidatus Paceibacterota bacterium]